MQLKLSNRKLRHLQFGILLRNFFIVEKEQLFSSNLSKINPEKVKSKKKAIAYADTIECVVDRHHLNK